MDREIVERNLSPTPSRIVNEYSSRRQRVWRDYKLTRNLSAVIREYHQLVRERTTHRRQDTRQQSPQQVGAFVIYVRRRAGYRYRPGTRSASAGHDSDAPRSRPMNGTDQNADNSTTTHLQASINKEQMLPGGSRSSSQLLAESGPPPSTVSMVPIMLVPNSDMLLDADLALLRKPTSAKPHNIKICNDVRSDTLFEFYDKFVKANNTLSRLKHNENLEPALCEVYGTMGIASFWNDFVALTTRELFDLTKRIEDGIMRDVLTGVRSGKLDVSHENQYNRPTARYDPRSDARGLEDFAAMAAKFLDPMEE